MIKSMDSSSEVGGLDPGSKMDAVVSEAGVEQGTLSEVPTSQREDLGAVLWQKVKSREYEAAMSEIKEEKHQKYLNQNSLDLVPVLLKLLNEDLDPEGEQCIEDLLVYVASVANTKEATIAFLEELEMGYSEKMFRVILHPIRTLLTVQISQNTRPTMFSWIFNTLYTRIVMLELPTGCNLEGKERKLLDADPRVQEVSSALHWLTNFYFHFFEKVMAGELVWGGKVVNSKEYLAFFLLQLFHKPISYLDIYCKEGDTESSLYRTCNDLAVMIARLTGNSFKLFSHVSWNCSKTLMATENEASKVENEKSDDENRSDEEGEKDEGKENEVSQLSLATFFYCILGQHMAKDYVPCVYSHQHVFINCLPLIVQLMQEKEDIPIHKGLILAKGLLSNITEKTLPCETLEAKAHSSFPQLLLRIMITCNNKEIRLCALEIFRPYLKKFESAGRSKLIMSLLRSVKHAGALGLVIHELKENIAQNMSQGMKDSAFAGHKLIQLINLACYLPDAEKSDLLEWSDSVMQALNLLVFLLLRDTQNITGIREALPKLETNFLTPIQTGLDLSRGHYELKLKDLEKPERKKSMETEVTVGGLTLPSMPIEQEKKVVQTALCSFDMMQCTLARVHQAAERKH